MKLMNERNQVRDVLARWTLQYPNGFRDDKGAIREQLKRMDVETATAHDVATIIGNGSWVAKPACHECGVSTWDCVRLGEEPDYESSTACICVSCLGQALKLAQQAQQGAKSAAGAVFGDGVGHG